MAVVTIPFCQAGSGGVVSETVCDEQTITTCEFCCQQVETIAIEDEGPGGSRYMVLHPTPAQAAAGGEL